MLLRFDFSVSIFSLDETKMFLQISTKHIPPHHPPVLPALGSLLPHLTAPTINYSHSPHLHNKANPDLTELRTNHEIKDYQLIIMISADDWLVVYSYCTAVSNPANEATNVTIG